MGKTVCLIGAGSYGTAVARIVADNLSRLAEAGDDFDATLKFWVRRSSLAEQMTTQRENPQYLPGAKLSANMQMSSDMVEVVKGCDVVILGIPSNHLSVATMDIIAEHAGTDGGTVHVISLAKGIEYKDGKLQLVSDILEAGLKHPSKKFGISVLMGANVADQMGRDEFAEATLGCSSAAYTSEEATSVVLPVFDDPDRFAVTMTLDRAAVEVSGALKNVVALAAGYSEGLELGSNTKAAIIRKGFKEIIRFGKLNFDNVQDSTFLESSGIADLMTTCFAGRGRRLAGAFLKCNRTKDWATLEKEMLNGQQIPDWHNAQHVYHFLKATDQLDKFPLFRAVYTIGFADADPMDIVEALKVPDPVEGAESMYAVMTKKLNLSGLSLGVAAVAAMAAVGVAKSMKKP